MSSEQLMDVRVEDDILIVRLDMASIGAVSEVEQLSRQMRQAVADHRPESLVVDFSGVVFFSSHVLGLLVDLWRRLRDTDGVVCISGINPHLTRVFRITNLDKLFSFYETTEHAITALQAE